METACVSRAGATEVFSKLTPLTGSLRTCGPMALFELKVPTTSTVPKKISKN